MYWILMHSLHCIRYVNLCDLFIFTQRVSGVPYYLYGMNRANVATIAFYIVNVKCSYNKI